MYDQLHGEMLRLADPYLTVCVVNGRKVRISECVEIPEAFLHLNDSIFDAIARSSEPELENARRIGVAIDLGQIPSLICKIPLNSAIQLTEEEIKNDLCAFLASESVDFKPSDLAVDFLAVNSGMAQQNPFDQVI